MKESEVYDCCTKLQNCGGLKQKYQNPVDPSCNNAMLKFCVDENWESNPRCQQWLAVNPSHNDEQLDKWCNETHPNDPRCVCLREYPKWKAKDLGQYNDCYVNLYPPCRRLIQRNEKFLGSDLLHMKNHCTVANCVVKDISMTGNGVLKIINDCNKENHHNVKPKPKPNPDHYTVLGAPPIWIIIAVMVMTIIIILWLW